MAEEKVDLASLQKSVETLFERIDVLEGRANDLELNNGSLSSILKKIEGGFGNWKAQQERGKEDLESRIKSIGDGLKLNAEADKAQTSQIGSLEDNFSKLVRQIEGITDRLEGGYEKAWSYEQIRSTVRNSAFTGTILRYLLGLVGVSGVGGVAAVLFGFGQVDEQEFTYLGTHLELQERVSDIELQMASWETVINAIDIEVKQPTP